MKAIDVDLVRSLFNYDPESGVLYRRKGRNAGKRAGSMRVGNKGDAYRLVYVSRDQGHVYEHRLIWAMVTGKSRFGQIDHRDGDGLNNRWSNLRAVSDVENKRNRPRQRNSPGIILGVTPRGNSYLARIGLNGKYIDLGLYDCQFEAVCARKSAEARLGYSENHGRSRPRRSQL